ncbi:hypothetical protein PYW07_008949 [Mythimna separata]|uniref:Serpin domain-containing protein n=1 Tax=Mythimna separata TaxID=271217 RepID=A0AAD7YBH3_MYTSE|nr:hypothetical protein PYW07_008949 [Mythimna separata]
MRLTIAAVLIFASFQNLDCANTTSNQRGRYFDIDLLQNVAEGKRGNVMVSPFSIQSTLAMLLEGAQGSTAAEIQTALRLPPNKGEYRQQLSELVRDLQVSTSVQNANGLFVSKKLPLNKHYEKVAKRLYFSEVNNVDFNNPGTSANVINGWVSNNTKGLITNIIDQGSITPETQLIVTNALYFKGIWQHEFEPKLTHASCFYRDSICTNVSMMILEAELNYAYVDNLRAHALELPYQGDRYSMILLVPQDRDAGVAVIRDLPYVGLLQISKQLRPSDVILTMPKFTVEYSEDIVTALKNMRITSLFSTAANLSGIFENPKVSGHVSSIIHKVYMQVDEKGTIAAAASAGQIVPLINNYVNVRVDRPFLFFIWDNLKKVVLFEGKIEEPTKFNDGKNNFSNNNNGNQNQGYENVKQQPTPAQYSPLQPSPPQYSPPQPSPPQYSPLQPSPPQYSPPQPSPPQPSPLQYSPLQPSPLQYSPLQPSPPQYSPLQPSPLQYSPPQPSPPQPSSPQYSPPQPSPQQYSPLQPSPPQYSPPRPI